MMAAAAAVEVGGVALDATGVGAVVGVPLNLGGAALGPGDSWSPWAARRSSVTGSLG
jgi:hypothetical protein